MNMRKKLDISAYLVVGPENTKGRPVASIVKAAVDSGFTCIQIRSKVASALEMIELCRLAADVIEKAGKSDIVTLLVNDRLDVVLAARMQGVKVDGIHVGQTDIPVDVCRKYLGDDSVIGLSADSRELIDYLKNRNVDDIDYFGTGPLHETATKPDCGMDADGNIVIKGLAEIKELVSICPLPIVVGGGVKLADIPALARTGVDGFFVVSAVSEADDPADAAKKLADSWRKSIA